MSQGSYSESFSLTISDETTAAVMAWTQSEMTEDLVSMPRVGPVTAQCFRDAGVETTYALLGKFLSLKTQGCSSLEHCERFWIWINGVTENKRLAARDKATICRCICLRAQSFMPGLYDESAYTAAGAGATGGGSAMRR